MAAIAHAATLESRVPVPALLRRLPHVARGREDRGAQRRRPARADRRRRRSRAPRSAALTPDRPVLRGTAQNPDVFFQAREARNRFYDACPDIVERTMRAFAALTGRRYRLFEYVGRPGGRARDRDHGIGRRDGARDRRLPDGARREGRRAEGAAVSPVLAQRVPRRAADDRPQPRRARPDEGAGRARRAALSGRRRPRSPKRTPRASRRSPCRRASIGGRYGLSSKEFTPAMVKAVFDEHRARTSRSITSPSASSTT